MAYKTRDKYYVVRFRDGTYWCGSSTQSKKSRSKQIREAMMYTDIEYAEKIRKKFLLERPKIYEISIRRNREVKYEEEKRKGEEKHE